MNSCHTFLDCCKEQWHLEVIYTPDPASAHLMVNCSCCINSGTVFKEMTLDQVDCDPRRSALSHRQVSYPGTCVLKTHWIITFLNNVWKRRGKIVESRKMLSQNYCNPEIQQCPRGTWFLRAWGFINHQTLTETDIPLSRPVTTQKLAFFVWGQLLEKNSAEHS